jgi:hypothetical protein
MLPLPDTLNVTRIPLMPVTVKYAEAELLLASTAATAYAPVAMDGTVNVAAENDPTLLIEIDDGEVDITTPLNFMVAVDPDANPEPTSVTACPTGPFV